MSWPIKLLCESNIILCGGLVERIGCAAVAKRIMHDGDGVAAGALLLLGVAGVGD